MPILAKINACGDTERMLQLPMIQLRFHFSARLSATQLRSNPACGNLAPNLTSPLPVLLFQNASGPMVKNSFQRMITVHQRISLMMLLLSRNASTVKMLLIATTDANGERELKPLLQLTRPTPTQLNQLLSASHLLK